MSDDLEIVQHPTLGTLKFPKSMGPDERNASIVRLMASVHGTPSNQLIPPSTPAMPQSLPGAVQQQVSGLKNVPIGFAKSATQTATSPLLLQKVRDLIAPFVPSFAGEQNAGMGTDFNNQSMAPENINALRQSLQPQGGAQHLGAAIEQAAELYAGGKILPGSSVITRMGASGAVSGFDAYLHDQDPKSGALLGAGSSLLGELTRLASAKVTGAAMNANPQQAKSILNELSGVTPKQIGRQASAKSMALTSQMEQVVSDADSRYLASFQPEPGVAYRVRDAGNTGIMPVGTPHAQATLDPQQAFSYAAGRGSIQNAPQEIVKVDLTKLRQGIDYTPVNGGKWIKFNTAVPESYIEKVPQGLASTKPALQVVDREMQKAVTQNNQTYYDKLQTIKDQLTKEFQSGQAIPQDIQAKKILDLKRGIGGLVNSWDAQTKNTTRSVLKQVYGALDSELDKAAPGVADFNQRISGLIGASKAATKTAKQTSGSAFLGNLRRGEYMSIVTRPLSSPTAFVSGARAAQSPATDAFMKSLALQLANQNVLPPEE